MGMQLVQPEVDPWRDLKDVEIWCLGTWFRSGLGHVRLMVGLNLKGLFQQK